MTVSFNIEYRTSWGEEVRIAGLLPESIPMHTTDGIYWTADVELEVPKEGMTINYSYQIEQNQIIIRKEWDSFPRRLFLSGNSKKKYQIKDCWKNIPEQLYYYSSAFTEALLALPGSELNSALSQKRAGHQGIRPTHQQRLLPGNLRKSESIGKLGPGQSDSHERCQLSGMADRAGCK